MTATVIVAPPPTPNGDLHVGHLSGPYLGADIYRRYMKLRHRPVVSALSMDLHQTYVVTTAQERNLSPRDLALKSYHQVRETLQMALIDFDHVGMPNEVYIQSISDWFKALYDAGVVVKRTQSYAYDLKQGRFLFESYASGRCPICLACSNGNICEACGHPNTADKLIRLRPSNGSPNDPIEHREVVEFYLNLESMRRTLETYLANEIVEKRPALRRLLTEVFETSLPDFPVTFPTNWGIPAPFPDSEGLCLNVWAEMVPGHYFWIDEAARKTGRGKIVTPHSKNSYVQYFGFDNSFFYVIAQLALALAARKAGLPSLLPTAFITNEFYQLDNFKFSTSQGHLIWGRDLLTELSADEARFYFAWNNPEYNQANFTRTDLDSVLNNKLRIPIREIFDILQDVPDVPTEPCRASKALLARFENAYATNSQSLRIAASAVANGLDLVLQETSNGTHAGQIKAIVQAIAIGLWPISPGIAEQLWQASGRSGAVIWPDTTNLASKAAE